MIFYCYFWGVVSSMEKMKVLHVVEALGGGVFTYMKELSVFFGKQNKSIIDTTIVYSSKRDEVCDLDLEKELSNGVSLIKLDMNKDISLLDDARSVLALIKIFKQEQPQVIHLHSSIAGILGKTAAMFYRKAKIFYTPHGYSFLRKDISPSKKRFFYLIEKYTANLLKGTTIACGDTEFQHAKKLGKSLMIRNGINVEEIAKETESLPDNERLVLGIIGRITFAKNPWMFNKIAENNPDIDFIWIGDGELREFTHAPNITITGWMKREEVFRYLNKLDAYIQTSLWEGLPMAPLEAMAMRKPIIASHVNGNQDVVIHGETGYLFENEKDVQPFIEKIRDKKLRKQMGDAAFERCEKVFDSNRNFTDLMNIYLDAVNNDKKTGKPSSN